MKKLLAISLLGFSAVTAAAQPVSDTENLMLLKTISNQLDNITNLLADGKQNAYTCTDGDKRYSAGFEIKRENTQYKCIVKGDHAEWDGTLQIPIIH